jgi:hypothetical protein
MLRAVVVGRRCVRFPDPLGCQADKPSGQTDEISPAILSRVAAGAPRQLIAVARNAVLRDALNSGANGRRPRGGIPKSVDRADLQCGPHGSGRDDMAGDPLGTAARIGRTPSVRTRTAGRTHITLWAAPMYAVLRCRRQTWAQRRLHERMVRVCRFVYKEIQLPASCQKW